MYSPLVFVFKGPVHLMLLENEKYTTSHTHNFLELVYVRQGSANCKIGNNSEIISAGNYFIIDYYTPHEYVALDDNLSIVNCLFYPEFILETSSNIDNFNELCKHYFYRIAKKRILGPASNQIFLGDEKTGRIFDRMLEEYSNKNEGYLEILRFLISSIIIEIIRKVGVGIDVSHSTKKILNIIENNYSSKISLSEICQKIHYSVPYVSKKFKEDTGLTFTDYLQKLRVQKSCKLLCESRLPISHIAESVGYQDSKFFYKTFKRFTGLSPSKYRKINR